MHFEFRRCRSSCGRWRAPLLLALGLAALAAARAGDLPATKPQPQPPCDTRNTVVNLQRNASLAKAFFAGPGTCNSLLNIFKRLAGSGSAGGKKLEDDKPFDSAGAAQERQAARADAEFAGALKALQATETDPLRLLVLEAALLDEFGYYAARELVLREAQPLLTR